MSRLTDTQLIIMSAASQRDDRGVELPATIKGEAARKLVDKLMSAGLLEEVHATGSLPVWRRDDDSGPMALRITRMERRSTPRSRACAVSTSRNCRPDGTRRSGGERRPLTCPAICCFVFWLIGCKPIGSAISMPTVGVCLTGSGRGLRTRLPGSRLNSTDPEPS
jgi:hypothetical protein